MVDTRRLEKFIGLGGSGDATEDAQGDHPRQRRSLALSGHREMRRPDIDKLGEIQRRAAIDRNWAALPPCIPETDLDAKALQFNLMARDANVVSRFDVLRTQLVQSFRSRKLVSLGLSAPKAQAGVSFATAGLIAALARRGDLRVVGLDLNPRTPGLQRFFETRARGSVLDFLSGRVAPEAVLCRVTETVAVAFTTPVPDMELSTLFSADDLQITLADIREQYAPDLIVCDLPPMLHGDMALAMSTHLDAMLLVADSLHSMASELMECERMINGQTEFLGVILNKYRGGEMV